MRATLQRNWSVALVVVLGVAILLRAGQTTPPAGPVGPTMKTLADLSAEHAAIQAAIGGGVSGGGGIKRVIHGALSFTAGDYQESYAITPAINPGKSLVLLDVVIATSYPGSPTAIHGRTGAYVAELTGEALSIEVDNTPNLVRRVSFQIVEYY